MASDMTVEGLRRFCRMHDVTRSHGMNKRETIRAIMEQSPESAVRWLRVQGYEVVDGFAADASNDEDEEKKSIEA